MTHRMVATLLALVPLFIASLSSQEVALTRKQVPKPVLDAFAKAYPHATIRGFSKEVEKGTTTIEVESVEGVVHRDVSYAVDGSLIALEESLPVAELPEAVRSAVAKAAPKAKVSSCEKTVKGSITHYELVVLSGKKKVELVFSPEGALIGRE